jgi:hypothetical protein
MYEFILDMSPISSFAHINWNKLLLKILKLWKMDSQTYKMLNLSVFSLLIKVYFDQKFFGKGWQMWNKACVEFGLTLMKLNKLVKTK